MEALPVDKEKYEDKSGGKSMNFSPALAAFIESNMMGFIC